MLVVGEGRIEIYSLRILAPPPVPVTHPRCQNFEHNSGIRFAGCWEYVEVLKLCLFQDVRSDRFGARRQQVLDRDCL